MSCEISGYSEIHSDDPNTRKFRCKYGGNIITVPAESDLTGEGSNSILPSESECQAIDLSDMSDMSNVSIHSLNCDTCATKSEEECTSDTSNTCFWNTSNSSQGNSCMDTCRSRLTKGDCEQYHIFNESSLTEQIYSFDGVDGECEWRPNVGAMDTTVDSREGICRRKDQLCYEPCTSGDFMDDKLCIQFKEGTYWVNQSLATQDIGEVYCGNYFEVPDDCPSDPSACSSSDNESCVAYRDPRYDPSVPDSESGICISDGMETIDLDTGESQGLQMTDEDCSNFTRDQCSNYAGTGCIWEPFNEYCVPQINKTSVDSMLQSCQPIQGHMPGNYDVNMLHEEHLDVSRYRDSHNQEYPYTTSKYLCDVCHIREKDLDTMYNLQESNETDKLKYFMLKKYVDFGLTNSNRSTPVSTSPQEYCERNINEGEPNQYNPCEWISDDSISKGGTCQSICSQHTPDELSEGNSLSELTNAKQECSSHQWYPENNVHTSIFPNIHLGDEDDTDYFDDRYCSWDGFECHNSIPCKQAQQTRCEDLGYDWYEGTALDVMEQAPTDLGIPLDLSSSYPIERKGDGKPIEGDMEGVCIYPNTEQGYIGQPAQYRVQQQYSGHQVIILKWREYGSGWWEDSSLCRKLHTTEYADLKRILQENDGKTYFLGEHIALVSFEIEAGDTPENIKQSINTKLRNYEYFVYNGDWVVWAADVMDAIDRSYDSTVDESYYGMDESPLDFEDLMNYGYNYYSDNERPSGQIPEQGSEERINLQRLNVIYDMRGTIDLLPVLNGRCALEISTFSIDTTSGNVTFEVSNPTVFKQSNKRFEFVEFIGKEIFGNITSNTSYSVAMGNAHGNSANPQGNSDKLTLVKLSKYKYSNNHLEGTREHPGNNANNQLFLLPYGYLPHTLEEGYGTLYENKYKLSLSPLNQDQEKLYDIQSTNCTVSTLIDFSEGYTNPDSTTWNNNDKTFHSSEHFSKIRTIFDTLFPQLLNMDTSDSTELYYDLADLSHTNILGPNPFPLCSVSNIESTDFESLGWAYPIPSDWTTVNGIYSDNSIISFELSAAMYPIGYYNEVAAAFQFPSDTTNQTTINELNNRTTEMQFLTSEQIEAFPTSGYGNSRNHVPEFSFGGEFTKAKALVHKEGIPYYDLKFDVQGNWAKSFSRHVDVEGMVLPSSYSNSDFITTFTQNTRLEGGDNPTQTEITDPFQINNMMYAITDGGADYGGHAFALGVNPSLSKYFTEKQDTIDFSIPDEVNFVPRLCSGSLESEKVIRVRRLVEPYTTEYTTVSGTDPTTTFHGFNLTTGNPNSVKFNENVPTYQTVDFTNDKHHYMLRLFLKHIVGYDNESSDSYYPSQRASDIPYYTQAALYSITRNNELTFNTLNYTTETVDESNLPTTTLSFEAVPEADNQPARLARSHTHILAPTIFVKSNFNLIEPGQNPLEDSTIRQYLELRDYTANPLRLYRNTNGFRDTNTPEGLTDDEVAYHSEGTFTTYSGIFDVIDNYKETFYQDIDPTPRENTSLIRPFKSVPKNYLIGHRNANHTGYSSDDPGIHKNYIDTDINRHLDDDGNTPPIHVYPDDYYTTFDSDGVYEDNRATYYENEFPPRIPGQEFITNVFFGSGKNTSDTNITGSGGASFPELITIGTNTVHGSHGAIDMISDYVVGDSYLPTTIQENNDRIVNPPSETVTKYFTATSVFPKESTAELNICKELIRDKLLTCGNSLEWDSANKDGCNSCFGFNDRTNLELCSQYTSLIEGIQPDTSLNSVVSPSEEQLSSYEIASNVGVCGILEYNRSNSIPWYYTGVTLEPPGFGDNLPRLSPYDNRDCVIPVQDDGSTVDIELTLLEGAGDSETMESVTFFKPVRDIVSDIFLDTLEDRPYGCIRQDLTLMDKDSIELSCNTNLSTPVERDKHILINAIINESNGELNISDRTKLAIMSEEELINKAIELDISIDVLNHKTKPKLTTVTRDRYNPYVCEGTGEPCTQDSDCSGHFQCGLYEEWNDLQKYYYNIPNSDEKRKFTNRKQWDMIGCGIDLNYSDGSSGENVCKDKYPGLCQTNADKCESSNDEIRQAIMLDCPETCNVQFSDLSQYETDQVGPLSICTARGRCRWSHDQDPSNLLPLCSETTARSLGSIEQCRNYNSLDSGPNAGSCNLYDFPETIDSRQCAEQRCLSMEGCVFTEDSVAGCYSEEYIDTTIGSLVDCDSVDGRWIGQSDLAGECILPSYFNTDIDESDCAIIGGTWRPAIEQACEYQPDIGYIGEDPCSHIVDLDDLSEDELLLYFYESNTPLYVDTIEPQYDEDAVDGDHPHYLQLNLTHPLRTHILNFDQMNLGTDYPIYPNNKYIYIRGNSEVLDAVCSPHIVGKSKIIEIVNETTVIIGGPDKAYLIPLDLEQSELNGSPVIDIGGENSCEVAGIYDIENYFTNSDGDEGQRDSCLNNVNASCTYEVDTQECKSCSRYLSEESCFSPGKNSHCGWGSVKNVCETIGNIDECNKLHLVGCEWNVAQEKCSLNEMTDTDGNPLVSKIGCVKCDEIQHRDACHSIKNCFWDAVTNTDGDGIGECRACSSITPDTSDGILPETGESVYRKCDNFQLTGGQCQFRNPDNEVTGIWDSITHFMTDELNLFEELFTTPDISEGEHSLCADGAACECMPTRLYPLFPDWIFHNIVLIVVFIPFFIYFIYGWYQIVCSPYAFKDDSPGGGEGNQLMDLAKQAKKLKKGGAPKSKSKSPKWMSKSREGETVSDQLSELYTRLRGKKESTSDDKSSKLREAFNRGKDKINNATTRGKQTLSDVKDKIKLKKGESILRGIVKTDTIFKRTSFDELFPKTEVGSLRRTIVLKLFFLVASFPFTIIQYLTNHIRLAIPTRLHNAVDIPGIIYIATIPTPLGYLLQLLWWLFNTGLFFYLISVGVSLQMKLLDYGVKENHNYVDPVRSNNDSMIADTVAPSAKWPQRIYREEWDEMLEDPLAEEVIQDRNDALPDIFHGDLISAAKIANAEIEPEDLNWSKYLRKPLQLYNNIVNYLGDEFILNWILGTIIMYVFYRSTNSLIEKFKVDGDQTSFILKMILSYFAFSVVYGILTALMEKPDTKDDEYDGAEIKCYGDIPVPFLKVNGEQVNFPKLCAGRATNEDLDECPYGCFHKGSGKKCKDNRSIFTLGGILDPDPKLNLPIPSDDASEFPADWNDLDEDGNVLPYTCPPTPSHVSKFPYDALCSSGQTRCVATTTSKHLMAGSDYPDEYCEIQYRNAAQSTRDEECINNLWTTEVTEGIRGRLETEGYDIQCQLEVPDFSQDTNCPFEMATVELNYDFDEMEQRSSASIWQWGYDELFNGGERLSEPEQISWQNENRYMIVNQQYGNSTMFS